jgi:hypothetical protein
MYDPKSKDANDFISHVEIIATLAHAQVEAGGRNFGEQAANQDVVVLVILDEQNPQAELTHLTLPWCPAVAQRSRTNSGSGT